MTDEYRRWLAASNGPPIFWDSCILARIRLARFIGRALLNRVGRIVAARMADDRAEQHQEEGEGQTGQPDADALGAASGLVRHAVAEAMSRFDIMQARALDFDRHAAKGRRS